jgi:hypothetical protein
MADFKTWAISAVENTPLFLSLVERIEVSGIKVVAYVRTSVSAAVPPPRARLEV